MEGLLIRKQFTLGSSKHVKMQLQLSFDNSLTKYTATTKTQVSPKNLTFYLSLASMGRIVPWNSGQNHL